MSAARNHRLDVARGVLICLVVLGHHLELTGDNPAADGLFPGWWESPQKQVLAALYLFHMPAFVLLAGVTARSQDSLRRVIQLITLFLVLDIGYELVNLALGSPMPTTLGLPFFALWFLLALAWWQLSMPLVTRFPRVALAVSVVAAVTAGAIDVDPGPLSWSRAVYFWPFFIAGHLIGRRAFPTTVPRRWRVAGLITFVTGLAAYVWIDIDPAWSRGNAMFGTLGFSFAQGVLWRTAALAAAAVTVAAFLTLLPDASGRLERLGRHSLAIYAWHIGGVVALQLLLVRIMPDGPRELEVLMATVTAALSVWLFSQAPFERAVRRILTALTPPRTPAPRPLPDAGDAPRRSTR